VLSEYQTRVFETFAATLSQNLPALKESLDNVANPRVQPGESGRAWVQVEKALHPNWLDRALEYIYLVMALVTRRHRWIAQPILLGYGASRSRISMTRPGRAGQR
jgi:hypothetical protein